MEQVDVAGLRTALSLTQGQLAQLLGVHPLTVSKWERGALSPGPHEVALMRSFLAAHGHQPEIGASIGQVLVAAGVTYALYKLLEAAFAEPRRSRQRRR
jgi:putative transcriptional regulator